MKREQISQSSNNRSIPTNNGSDETQHPCINRASDSAQILSHIMSGDALDSLDFENIASASSDESEDVCQQHICLPHLKSSHSSLTSLDVVLPDWSNLQQQVLKDMANQPPTAKSSTDKSSTAKSSANVAPDAAVDSSKQTALLPSEERIRLEMAAQFAQHKAQYEAQYESFRAQAEARIKTLERRVRSRTLQYPWQGRTQLPVAPTARNASRRPIASHNARTIAQSTPLKRRLPAPALQATTYQLADRSQQVTAMNAIIRSAPRLVMLFLLGTALAALVGVAFPVSFSWLALRSALSVMLRGLGVAIFFSLAAAFVLECR